jgi:hypothetical protein
MRHAAFSRIICNNASYMAKLRTISDPDGLGRAVRDALKGRRSQKDVESRAKVHQSQVSRVTTGEMRRFTENVRRVCEYANVNAEPYLAPIDSFTDKDLLRLASAACNGRAHRNAIVAQILHLLAKLR